MKEPWSESIIRYKTDCPLPPTLSFGPQYSGRSGKRDRTSLGDGGGATNEMGGKPKSALEAKCGKHYQGGGSDGLGHMLLRSQVE